MSRHSSINVWSHSNVAFCVLSRVRRASILDTLSTPSVLSGVHFFPLSSSTLHVERLSWRVSPHLRSWFLLCVKIRFYLVFHACIRRRLIKHPSDPQTKLLGLTTCFIHIHTTSCHSVALAHTICALFYLHPSTPWTVIPPISRHSLLTSYSTHTPTKSTSGRTKSVLMYVRWIVERDVTRRRLSGKVVVRFSSTCP